MRALVVQVTIAALLVFAGCSSQAVDDSALTAKVKSKLATDSQTSAIKIGVETKAGIVTLSGSVPTATERDEASKIAKSTEGVKGVVNEIKIAPESADSRGIGETVSDAAILAKVKSKLIADGITGTDVDVDEGKVVLKGQVDDAKQKVKAEEIAKNTDGVKGVMNRLTVKKS